jgi:hemerythrin-like domain-containing protein
MIATKRYVEQHDELLDLANDIIIRLNFKALAEDATEVRSLLSKFLGRLTVHLAMEDRSLYPSLLEQEDESVKAMARRFVNEMGGIAEAVDEYAAMWASAVAIQDNPKVFIAHTNNIINALARRIDKENNELYKAYNDLEKILKVA